MPIISDETLARIEVVLQSAVDGVPEVRDETDNNGKLNHIAKEADKALAALTVVKSGRDEKKDHGRRW